MSENKARKYQPIRPVQRARVQDEYMEFYEEADPIPAGSLRLYPSDAPMVVKGDIVHAVKALEEAPDGYRRLDWSGQGLTTVPKIPNSFKNARIVMLNDNKITSFPEELSSMQILQRLHIDCNSVDQVPPYISTFSVLMELKASENSITSISSNIGRCEYLMYLELQKNQLSDIPPTLGMCTNLERLWLSYNRLQTLPFTLSHLCSLKSLRADRNEMTSIGFNVGKLTDLAQMRLGHNRIVHIDQNIGGALALRELHLESNLIQALPPSIGHMKITNLRLDENPLQRPPLEIAIRGAKPVFEFLARMQYALESWDLDLSGFGLRIVPFPQPAIALQWEVDSWVRCKTLSLENNRLVSLPVEIDLMSNLTILDLQHNFLSTIPPTLGKITSLQVLDVAGNEVQALPANLKNNVRMTELLLENNKLTSIPPVVMEMGWLKDLRMTSNKITLLPQEWSRMTALEHLDLGFNSISSLPDNLSSLISLKVVRFPCNKIRIFPESLVKLRLPDDPPKEVLQAHNGGHAGAVGGRMSNPRSRKQHVVDVLFGGVRPPYRDLERTAAEDREYKKPEGAEDMHGWALVRFALFGKDGPRLVAPLPKKVEEKPKEESSDSDDESERAEAPPPKRGFVGRLRGIFRKKPKVPVLDGTPGQGPGVSEKAKARQAEGGEPGDVAAEGPDSAKKGESTRGEEKQEEKKGGMLRSLRGSMVAVIKKTAEKLTESLVAAIDLEGDDYGPYLKQIVEIDFSNNMLERIPNQIGHLSTLTVLKLSGNKIEKIPPSIKHCRQLTEVNFARNLILDVPIDFKALLSLQKLDLSCQLPGDLLADLPWEMRSLHRLKELRLSNNCFKYLPQCIFPSESEDDLGPGMTSLRTLAVDHNPLLGIDEDLACCPLLQRLLIHNTKVRRLHNSIGYNQILEEIWISDTAIRKIDPAVATLRHLKKIVLNHEDQLNDFTEIRRSIRSSVWCFLSEGEGMMAELSAMQKLEAKARRNAAKGMTVAAAMRQAALGDKDSKEMSMKEYRKQVLAKSKKPTKPETVATQGGAESEHAGILNHGHHGGHHGHHEDEHHEEDDYEPPEEQPLPDFSGGQSKPKVPAKSGD